MTRETPAFGAAIETPCLGLTPGQTPPGLPLFIATTNLSGAQVSKAPTIDPGATSAFD
jgi:hypothetical protein